MTTRHVKSIACPHPPLLIPPLHHALVQLGQADSARLVAGELRLDDVRGQGGQAEHSADVGPVHAGGFRQVGDLGKLARFELLLPGVGLGDGPDQRLIGLAPPARPFGRLRPGRPGR